MQDPDFKDGQKLRSTLIRPEDYGDGYLKQDSFHTYGPMQDLRNASEMRTDDNRRRRIVHTAMLIGAVIVATLIMSVALSAGGIPPTGPH